MAAAEPARPELPAGWPQVLAAIVKAPAWYITRNELARVLVLDDKRGRPLRVLATRLDAMIAAQWLEPWTHERAAAVTLSPLAAVKLGCKLTQPEDPEKEPRWIDTATVLWPRVNLERHFVDVDLAVTHSAYDPQPMPDEQAAEAEEFKREAQAAVRELLAGDRSRFDRLLHARPRILLTGSHTVWHEQTIRLGHQFEPRPACSTCYNQPLLEGAICLECFAWWLDEHYRWKGERAAA